jgi:hypothetical protein
MAIRLRLSSAISRLTRPNAAIIELWVLAALVIGVSAAFARRYPLRGNSETLTDIGKLSHYGHPEFWRWLLGITLLTVAAAIAPYLALKGGRRSFWPILVGAIGAAIAFAAMYPVNAIDVFIYAARSRLYTEYGLDPLTALPNLYVDRDPYFHYASSEWGSVGSPYGPLWNLVAAPVTIFGGASITHALIGFKIMSGAAFLGCGALIWRTVERMRPGAGIAAATVFLWNPLVLWEGIGNAHNDLVMIFFVLAACWAWSARRDEAIVPLIIVAVLIKYVALVILPIMAVSALCRQRSVGAAIKLMAWWVLLGGAVVALGLSPFYDLDAIKTSVRGQSDILLTSPGSALFHEFQLRGEPDSVSHTIIRAGQIIAGIIILGLTILAAWRPSRMIRYAFEAFFILLLFGVPALREWYGIWIIALAALLPLGWPAARAIVFAAGALGSYGLAIWIQAWRGTNFADIGMFMVLLMLGPAILVALLEAADSYAWWKARKLCGDMRGTAG